MQIINIILIINLVQKEVHQVLSIKNNKLVAIHRGSNIKEFIQGLFLNYPIKEY